MGEGGEEWSPVVVEHAVVAYDAQLGVLGGGLLHVVPQLEHLQQVVAPRGDHRQPRLPQLAPPRRLRRLAPPLLLCPAGTQSVQLSGIFPLPVHDWSEMQVCSPSHSTDWSVRAVGRSLSTQRRVSREGLEGVLQGQEGAPEGREGALEGQDGGREGLEGGLEGQEGVPE
eukprot:896618-Prorocentrum_minimum.AAC.1